MAKPFSPRKLLVAVGSRHDRVCSIGAFARAEAKAMRRIFDSVEVLEPDADDRYPVFERVAEPDVIFFHAPALHDRKRPWNALASALKLKRRFPRAKFVSIVHEYTEAPAHWKLRQALLARLSDATIVNTEGDYKGVHRWQPRTLRSQLGPTLFIEELLENPSVERIAELRAAARRRQSMALSIDANEKWLVHPGLLTPGKGVNFLSRLAPHLPPEARLLVMGGLGPKERDRDFARGVVAELTAALAGRFAFVDSPSDEVFKDLLLAADLVVLPYDAGLSERRSSFLSAMCCGANVWTTTGEFSGPLELARSGAHTVSAAKWAEGDAAVFMSVLNACGEPESRVLERRRKNLVWAAERSWSRRALQAETFFAKEFS